MVKQSAESQFKCRARKALAEGKDFKVRGEANRALFEELKKEVVAASSSSKNEKNEAREALSEDTPGVQELYFHDGLGVEVPYAGSDRDGDSAPESADPVDPDLLHARQVFDAAVRIDPAPQEGAECLRRELAKAHTDLERLRALPGASLRQELDEAQAEISRLKCDNSKLWLENQRLVNHNKELETRLSKCSRNAMAEPSVQAICTSMKNLALENAQLQTVVSRQVELNDLQAAQRSQSADARPAKSQKGFGVGDVVYVASEYWHLMGKHPKAYDHTTRFVIVKQAPRQGFWDLCAKKDVGIKQKKDAGKSLPPAALEYVRQQAQLQSLYQAGHLGDVPARLLSAYPSPPGSRMSAYVPFIDLTKK